MIFLKDFKPGETVWVVRKFSNSTTRYLTDYEIYPKTVSKTGRTYVYTDSNTRYKIPDMPVYTAPDGNNLVEDREYGYPSYLFLTKEAAEAYVETKRRISSIYEKATNRELLSKLSLDTLRTIDNLLKWD